MPGLVPFRQDPEVEARKQARLAARRKKEAAKSARAAEAARRAAELYVVQRDSQVASGSPRVNGRGAGRPHVNGDSGADGGSGGASRNTGRPAGFIPHSVVQERAVDPCAKRRWLPQLLRRHFAAFTPRWEAPPHGRCILYWVSAIPRVRDNWGLWQACWLARAFRLPLSAYIVLPSGLSCLELTGDAAAAEAAAKNLPPRLASVATAVVEFHRRLAGLGVPLSAVVGSARDGVRALDRITQARRPYIIVADEVYDPQATCSIGALVSPSETGGLRTHAWTCPIVTVDSTFVVPVRFMGPMPLHATNTPTPAAVKHEAGSGDANAHAHVNVSPPGLSREDEELTAGLLGCLRQSPVSRSRARYLVVRQ